MEKEIKQHRQFGLMVGGIFAAIGVWPLVRRGEDIRLWAVVLGTLLMVPALLIPKSLGPVYRLWMVLGHALGWVNTRIILGAIFFGLITPMGLVMLPREPDCFNTRVCGSAFYLHVILIAMSLMMRQSSQSCVG